MKAKHFSRCIALLCSLALLLSGVAQAAVLGDELDAYTASLGSGLALAKGVYWTGSDYRQENYIEASPGADVFPIVVSGDTLCSGKSFSTLAAELEAQGYHVIAGINGDYFNTANYEPIGIVVENGALLSSDGGLGAIGFCTDGSVVFGTPDLSATVAWAGQSFPLSTINKARTNSGFSLFTARYAPTTKNSGSGYDIICSVENSQPLTLNGEITLIVEEILESDSAIAIPEGKVVLSISDSADSTYMDAVAALEAGSRITVTTSCNSQWQDVQYAVGSLYRLVADGQVSTDLDATAAPRTAVGVKADGTLVLYTIDGRQSGLSVGATMQQVAERLVELGCVDAGIMDGGGSTSLNAIYLGDTSLSQINSPAYGYQRPVSNYIMLVTTQAPTGTASALALYPLSTHILAGASTAFTVKAADQNGYAANVPANIAFSADEVIGTITQDGTFTAGSTAGAGLVTVSADGLTSSSVTVSVVETPDSITVSAEDTGSAISAVSLEPGETVDLTASAVYNHLDLLCEDNCFTWTADASLGTIDSQGRFTAGNSAGSGTITVSAGGCSATIAVTVLSDLPFTDVSESDWYFDAVDYVYKNGLFAGVADTVFSPLAEMSRGMLVTVLWRLAGEPASEMNTAFTDISPEDWYYTPVLWASENQVVQGYDAETFAPSDAITREQLAVLLYRYAGSPDAGGAVSGFTDWDAVSDWAETAMTWAVNNQLLTGRGDGILDAQATASRCEVAAVIMRYCALGGE